MSKYMLCTVIVCTHQSDGAPAFHVCTPEVTQVQIDEGVHYDKAIKNAQDLGYEGKAVAFDLMDPAASQLQSLAQIVRQAKSGQLALEILELDGGVITGQEEFRQLVPRPWAYKGKHGEEMTHVCLSKADAALMFTSCVYACGQNHWLQDVMSGSTVDSYVDWSLLKLREIRDSLRAKDSAKRIGAAS